MKRKEISKVFWNKKTCSNNEHQIENDDRLRNFSEWDDPISRDDWHCNSISLLGPAIRMDVHKTKGKIASLCDIMDFYRYIQNNLSTTYIFCVTIPLTTLHRNGPGLGLSLRLKALLVAVVLLLVIVLLLLRNQWLSHRVAKRTCSQSNMACWKTSHSMMFPDPLRCPASRVGLPQIHVISMTSTKKWLCLEMVHTP